MAEQIKIAIVDDEKDMRDSIGQWLALSGHKTETFASAADALKVVGADYPGIVISDIKMPNMDGIQFLKKLQALDSAIPVILITGHGDVAMAVEAMRIGAYDFLEKPFNPERMADLAKRAIQTRRLMLENRALRRELSDGSALMRKLAGTSPVMEKLREDILDLSQADGHLLIMGETGTGKSLIAHALHACGSRQGRKYITANCAAYVEEDLNARLFDGHEDQPAWIVEAAGGTLVLEDIETLPSSTQAKILNLIVDLENSVESQPLRIIGIHNDSDPDKPLESALRQDLYFRLAAMQIAAPPLRNRGEDILTLFNRYAETFAEEYGCDQPSVSAEDAAHLLQAPWPGNIRQLINLAERAVLQSRRGSFSISGLLMNEAEAREMDTETGNKPLKEHVEAFERMLIDNTMRRHKGSIQNVMEELCLPRRTLNEKMAKYGLTRANYVG